MQQLEDHLGDIIRKARGLKNVSLAAAAAAAGLPETEMTALEAAGKCDRQPNLAALAPLLGLNAAKLAGIASGWTPAPQNLSLWREIRVITTPGDGFTVNCYLVWDEVNREAALFDTGLDAQPVLDIITAEGLALRYIFITHSHYDHVQALGAIREAQPKAKVRSGSKNAPVDQRNKPAEIIPIGGLRVTHRETPGHAEDGVTYVIGNWQEDAPSVAVVGDALFAGSMGGDNGSGELARQKVKEQILTLPADTLICPGHGPMTTVAQEKQHNPFF